MLPTQQLLLLLGFALIYYLDSTQASPAQLQKAATTDFIILHNNDMHSRFEQTSLNSDKCTEEMAKSNKCYGGFARVAHVVRKFRTEEENGGTPVVYLNAGDTYTGTTWFYIFKDNITTAFLNKLQPDAMSLGNHEFDEGIDGLVPFLNNAKYPIVAANLDLSNAPKLQNIENLRNSTILEVKGVKIGVIGYLTDETASNNNMEGIKILDEIESINKESARLKALGINIILALGHSGYVREQEIAAKCSDVDVVIGGHSHTFLYSGPPDAERIEKINGSYPTVVTQASGKKVPVVQAYAYTKYLGQLHLKFDENGNLLEFDGIPMLLNADVPQDDDILQLLEVYRPNVTALENEIVGYTKVDLNCDYKIRCLQECNLGNLVTDALVHARSLENFGGTYWTDAAIAFVEGGGFQSSIEKSANGSILADDITRVLPWANDMFVTKISGKTLLENLEIAASIVPNKTNKAFLQMSGIHTKYNLRNPIGERVVHVEVLCAACNVPTFEPLDESKFYNVIVSEYLMAGGLGHKFVEATNSETPKRMQKRDVDAFKAYLKSRDYIYPHVEGRITVIDEDDRNGDGAIAIASSIVLVMLSLLAVKWIY